MRSAFFLFAFLLAQVQIHAQENIPIGEWRLHASYNHIRSVSAGDGKIFASARNGIIVLDQSDKSYTTLHKLNLLSRAGIRMVNYQESSGKLFVAYDGGTFDVVRGSDVKSFDPSKNTVLTGAKEIHKITFHDQLAFLATDYGVLVFDLQRNEIKETWRDLGMGGTTLKIFGATIFNDSVFLATEKGILAGDPNDNLLDFNKWKRMDAGDLDGPIQFVEVFNGKPVAVINGQGIYYYDNYQWIKQSILEGALFSSVRSSSANLILCESGKIWRLDEEGTVSQVDAGVAGQVVCALEDDAGKIWAGDHFNGLVTNSFGAFESIIPNGPASDISYNMTWHNRRLFVVPGGFSGTTPLLNKGHLSVFQNGSWSFSAMPLSDLTSVAVGATGDVFVSSFGFGVLNQSTGTLYDETNSTLINSNPPERNVRIVDMAVSADGLWVANQGTLSSLHLLSNDLQWQSFSLTFSQAIHPLKILVDLEGNVWMQTNPSFGGGIVVFDRNTGESMLLTELDENGELPSTAVYSLALDRDGYVWAGTDAGVAYFYDEGSDAVKPIFEDRFLLRDETVTAIAVDGGNRKWMGTRRGVWLFDPSGESAIANFTETNSPLLSDRILDIEIDPVSGEVFFATEEGLVSFRADATGSNSLFRDVTIFPNPVADNFNGSVGITGLATDAVVKITDVSGKLVYQTTANGGTASWNVRDHQGRRVPTGVFLVFAVAADGSESVVGKIAVVN